MRRLLIFPGYFLPHIGGLETHVDEFSKYLSKKNYSITIFAPKIPNNSKEEEWIHDNRVHVIRYPAFELISNFPVPKFWHPRFWKLFLSLNKILKSSRVTLTTDSQSLVMVRTRFFTNSFLGLLFAKFRFKRLPLMHVEHGSDFVRLHSRFKSFCAYVYDMIFGKLVIKLADSVVAISQSSHDFVCKHFLPHSQVPIFKRGVDFEYYKRIRKKDLGDKIVIMSLGRMYKWKGVENAIKAYKSLPKQVKEKSVYYVVGYGEDLDRLKKLASGERGIIFTGGVGFKEAVSYLKRADIFIHSSYPGGALSNSLLQSMECRCSIVASPNEGGREVIRDSVNGILLSDNSVESLSRGIRVLVENKKLRDKYGRCAQRDVRREFDWNKVVEQYEEEFDKLLK